MGLFGSFKTIAKTEGVMGFYRWIPVMFSCMWRLFVNCFAHDRFFCFVVLVFRGNGASVARIVPYAALHYMTYEQYRRWIILTFPDVGRGPVLDLMAGSFAGGTAVLFTYPLDLVRTKLAYQVSELKRTNKIKRTIPPPQKRKEKKRPGVTREVPNSIAHLLGIVADTHFVWAPLYFAFFRSLFTIPGEDVN